MIAKAKGTYVERAARAPVRIQKKKKVRSNQDLRYDLVNVVSLQRTSSVLNVDYRLAVPQFWKQCRMGFSITFQLNNKVLSDLRICML